MNNIFLGVEVAKPASRSSTRTASKNGFVPKNRRGQGLAILVLLVVVALVVYHLISNRKGPQHGVAPQMVAVASATLGEMPETLSALGTVTPVATVTVLPQLSGYLTAVGYREGQEVEKGQFLAQIDARQYEISKQQAEAQLAKDQAVLDQARADMARYEQLNATKSIAVQTYANQKFVVQQSEAAVKADRANIAQYELDIAYCHITAPVAGRIGLRLVDPGNYVTASSQPGIAVITTMKPTTVQFTVPQDALAKVLKRFNSGAQLPVTAYSSDNARQLAVGTLYAINNQMATATGTVTLRAMFPNDDEALFPNEFVNVKMLVDTQRDVMLVPTPAVLSGAPGNFVYLVNSDKTSVSQRKVTIGTSDGQHTVIVTGLNVGDQVVIDGTDRLSDKARIRIARQPASKGAPPAGAPDGQGGTPSGEGNSGRVQGPPAELSDAIGVSNGAKGRGHHRRALSPEAAQPFPASQVPAALPGAASGARGGRPMPVRGTEPARPAESAQPTPVTSSPQIQKKAPVVAANGSSSPNGTNGPNGAQGGPQGAAHRRPAAEYAAGVAAPTPAPAASRVVTGPVVAANGSSSGVQGAPQGAAHRRAATGYVAGVAAPAPVASRVEVAAANGASGANGAGGAHQGPAHRPARVAAASASEVARMLATVVAAADGVQQEARRFTPAAPRTPAGPVVAANGASGAMGANGTRGARQEPGRRSVPTRVAGAASAPGVGQAGPVIAANGANGTNGAQQEPGRHPVAEYSFHAAPLAGAEGTNGAQNGTQNAAPKKRTVRTVATHVPVLAAPQGFVALSASSPEPGRASGAAQVSAALQALSSGSPAASVNEDGALHLRAPAPSVVQTSTQAW